MSLAILFHFLCAQHVSDINISIIRSLQLFCWITKLVVLFLVRCVLEIRCGWVGVVSVLQAEAQLQPATKNNTTNVVIQQNSRKLLVMDILNLILLTWRIWWAPNNSSKRHMGFNSAFKGLISETCWAHAKWNNTASDIKLVFYSSTITVMHGPINIRFW